MNRRLTRFEIWFKTLERFEVNIILTIVLGLVILFTFMILVPYGLDKDAKMEDAKIKQYQESIR